MRSRAWPVLDAGKAQNQFPVALPRRREVYVLDRKAFRRPSIAQQFLVAVADLPQYETGGVVNEDSILALQELLDARGFQPAVVLHRQQVVPCADASILHVSAGIQTLAVQSYHARGAQAIYRDLGPPGLFSGLQAPPELRNPRVRRIELFQLAQLIQCVLVPLFA